MITSSPSSACSRLSSHVACDPSSSALKPQSGTDTTEDSSLLSITETERSFQLDTECSSSSDHTIVLNMRGERFTIEASRLAGFPETRLGRLCYESSVNDPLCEDGEFFYNKDPIMFTYVLDFYKGKDLHIPKDKCVISVQEDLDFWELDESLISLCCRKRYLASLNKLYKTQQIKRELASLALERFHGENKLERFLYNRNSSLAAKIWCSIGQWLVILAVAVVFCSTNPNFRVPFATGGKNDKGIVLTNKQVRLIMSTQPHMILVWLELICCVFFTFELLLKASVCCKHVGSFVNCTTLCTLVYLVPAWVGLLARAVDPESSIGLRLTKMSLPIHTLCILRVGLLYRLIWQNRDLKLLWFSLKSSIRELTLMLVLVLSVAVMSSTLMFATNLFVHSSVDSMFLGLWWAVVTITTVGYGDQSPQSWLGYIVACVCVLTGVIVTGMSIPLITRRFHVYYQTRLPADVTSSLKIARSGRKQCSCKLIT